MQHLHETKLRTVDIEYFQYFVTYFKVSYCATETNKYLAIANRSRVRCAHNRAYVDGIYRPN